MAMPIREAYQGHDPILLETAVEVDEAYFGGVEKRKHEDKKLSKGRGAVGKMAVVGIKEREIGYLVAKPVSDTTKDTLQGFIQDNCIVPQTCICVILESFGFIMSAFVDKVKDDHTIKSL